MSSARPPHSAALAIAVVFFVNGATFASWIPRIPEVQDQLGLTTSVLGFVLAGTGVGGLLGTVASPSVVARAGSRNVAAVAGAGVACILPLVAVVPAAWALALVLVAAASCDALTDIAMNDLGARTQRETGRSLMNRLHAGWSLGTVFGALVSSAVAAAGVGIGPHFAAVAVVLTAVLALAWRHLPAGHEGAPNVARTRRGTFRVAVVLMPLAFAAAVVEGVPAEWSGVFLAQVHDLGPGAVGLGFTLFGAAMLTGRLAGDHVIDGVGPATAAWLATAITSAGLVVVVAAGAPAVAIAGFGVLGLGTSVLFPLIYSAAASLTAVASGAGLALMSVGARLGFLAAPALVGLVAGAVGLRAAVAVLVGTALVVVSISRARLQPHVA